MIVLNNGILGVVFSLFLAWCCVVVMLCLPCPKSTESSPKESAGEFLELIVVIVGLKPEGHISIHLH